MQDTGPVTLAGTLAAANHFAHVGSQPNSIKLALWAAALSPRKRLSLNGKQTRILAQYVRHGLPTYDARRLRDYLQALRFGPAFGTQYAALTYIDQLSRDGTLEEFASMPRDWQTWRVNLADVLHGHGLGYKAVSFAAWLLWPLTCDLIPIDVHVCRRLNLPDTGMQRIQRTPRLYVATEEQIRQERDTHAPDVTLSVWHWYTWEQQRRLTGDSLNTGSMPESHDTLSPRWY